METSHRIVAGDSRSLSQVETNSVELVVTSPPYPMIEMWDDLFADLDPAIADCLERGDGQAAFDRMHAVLASVWEELRRVLVDGGIACINVGDATRKVDGSFRVYQNHSQIVSTFEQLGFEPLPEILWRKPVNSGAKFMGSGMLPTNAYVTLEHEYILVFRNGTTRRQFEPNSTRRYRSAYFWEERNRWFSDVWTDINGELQALDGDELRERSGAYPFEIPYRLINMYSVYEDTVLDPFWGTGTTTLAAMAAGRHSVGYELDEELIEVFDNRAERVPDYSQAVVEKRLQRHREFVTEQLEDGETLKYEAANYEFPVRTKQERQIQLYTASAVTDTSDGYGVSYDSVDEAEARILADADTNEAPSMSDSR